MSRVAELARAPKRGRYDRSLSRHERQAEQRERLLAATAAVVAAGRELNVANVIALAGVGRNTFYEYFDDCSHALQALSARARHELLAAIADELRTARTPFERVRAIARAWARNAHSNEELTLLMLRHLGSQAGPTSALGEQLGRVLEAETDSRSALTGLEDETRVAAVVAVFEAVTRVRLARDDEQHLALVLADLALRLLR